MGPAAGRSYGDRIRRAGTAAAGTLVVTVAVGFPYKQAYLSLFHRSVLAYCDKHGYDFLLVDDFIDRSEADPSLISLQKALVCSVDVAADYERVVFIDADILVNVEDAPSIVAETTPDLAGFVDEFSQPDPVTRISIQRAMGWETSAAEYYALCGFHLDTPHVVNSGVMVLSPRHHRNILEEIYLAGKRDGRNHPRGFHYEQSLIGYRFQAESRCRFVDNKWNTLASIALTANNIRHIDAARAFFPRMFRNCYFLHFAGRSHLPFIEQIDRVNRNCRQSTTGSGQ